MAIHDPEDAAWWCIYGEDKAKEFVNRVSPQIGLKANINNQCRRRPVDLLVAVDCVKGAR